ncbi:lysine N(6)-hydroxylase/L-ornithine N(5)-oxygenase family protein [Nocardioides bruguierae]|uniref:lysine N(6)-hydroxylase/L-ornithine N(5)-oxygenase family protein n=1 Tax=Nocardioides bruguierae TaxID=2945102 RepID=UPI002020F6D9|nr:SidA/IucD/PvdA family monooxygenase [Nocardioides bruguierae]MCL8026560.1 SidA/IucD/PvdA family monooxygenase [Nocardioides bruguierae]
MSAWTEPVHDVVGIGLGPFNLGLAALADPVPDLDAVFLEARDEVSWHPGMMLPESTLQVPFLADLVTMADPTSRWSFLSFLKESDRLYPFYVRESFYPLRSEYDDYLRWVAHRLPSVHLGRRVTHVRREDDGTYRVTTARGETWRGRRLVLGTGTSPTLPTCVRDAGGPAVHTAGYLPARERLTSCRTVTIVGSGQSAAEVYQDLLAASPEHDYDLVWLTRSPRFFPMEYTKLTLELTSPEYSAYFRSLPGSTRARLLREQRSLYKGISGDLVDAISDLHYRLRVQGQGPRTTLVTSTSLVDARWDGTSYDLRLHHDETDEDFGLRTDGLVLGTGYAARVPAFLDDLRPHLRLDQAGRYLADDTYAVDVHGGEVYVQNGEEHTHGFVAPDLGMGAHRSACIVNALTGREVYPVEKRVATQTFGIPDHLRRAHPETA